jgi:hypothetical protein
MDESAGAPAHDVHLVTETGMPQEDVLRALVALDGTYIEANLSGGFGAGALRGSVRALTERGRRAAGLWPSGEGVDALVDALRQAETQVDDEEEKSMLRRAAGALGGMSREIATDVLAAWVRSQTGL